MAVFVKAELFGCGWLRDWRPLEPPIGTFRRNTHPCICLDSTETTRTGGKQISRVVMPSVDTGEVGLADREY